jgi:hypothetical protein
LCPQVSLFSLKHAYFQTHASHFQRQQLRGHLCHRWNRLSLVDNGFQSSKSALLSITKYVQHK